MSRLQLINVHTNTALLYRTCLYRSFAFIECPILSLSNNGLADNQSYRTISTRCTMSWPINYWRNAVADGLITFFGLQPAEVHSKTCIVILTMKIIVKMIYLISL